MFALLTRVFDHQTPRARGKKTVRQLALERLDDRILLSSSSVPSNPAALLRVADPAGQAHILEWQSKPPMSISYQHNQRQTNDLFSANVHQTRGPVTPQQHVYNVDDFGARGDGVTDDRGAIQNAIDAAGQNKGGIVFLPTGRYRVTSSLLIPSSIIVIVGEGVAAVEITADSGFTVLESSDKQELRSDCGFEQFSIRVVGTTRSIGIDLTGFTDSFLLHLSLVISTPDGVGVYASGGLDGMAPSDNELRQVDVSGGFERGTIGIHFDEGPSGPDGPVGPNANRIIGGQIAACDYGIRISRGNRNDIYGVVIQSIAVRHYEFGNTRLDSAIENQVFGGYHENSPALSRGRLLRFNEGATRNTIYLGLVTGLGQPPSLVESLPGSTGNVVWYLGRPLSSPPESLPQLPPPIPPSPPQEILHQVHTYNVQQFGAKGDGVTDDTDAIQRALDAAAQNTRGGLVGGIVFLPAGRYRVTSSLLIKSSSIVVLGEDVDDAEIAADSGFAVFKSSDTNIIRAGCGFQDFSIRVMGTSRSIGIDLTGFISSFIDRLSAVISTPDGIGVYGKGGGDGLGPYYNQITELDFSGGGMSGTIGIHFDNVDETHNLGPNGNSIVGCKIAASDYGIKISGGHGNSIFDVRMESIRVVFYEFGIARPGSADENQVFGGSNENPPGMTARLIRFNRGAIGNTVYLGLVTGLGDPTSFVESMPGATENTVWYDGRIISPPGGGQSPAPGPTNSQRLLFPFLPVPQPTRTRKLLHFMPENDSAPGAGSVLGDELVTILDSGLYTDR